MNTRMILPMKIVMWAEHHRIHSKLSSAKESCVPHVSKALHGQSLRML